MRVRFINVLVVAHTWTDVDIVSTLLPRGVRVSDAKRRMENLKVWYRYVFLAICKLAIFSHIRIDIDGTRVYPRLKMLVSDQVQEEPMMSLKAHGGCF